MREMNAVQQGSITSTCVITQPSSTKVSRERRETRGGWKRSAQKKKEKNPRLFCHRHQLTSIWCTWAWVATAAAWLIFEPSCRQHRRNDSFCLLSLATLMLLLALHWCEDPFSSHTHTHVRTHTHTLAHVCEEVYGPLSHAHQISLSPPFLSLSSPSLALFLFTSLSLFHSIFLPPNSFPISFLSLSFYPILLLIFSLLATHDEVEMWTKWSALPSKVERRRRVTTSSSLSTWIFGVWKKMTHRAHRITFVVTKVIL